MSDKLLVRQTSAKPTRKMNFVASYGFATWALMALATWLLGPQLPAPVQAFIPELSMWLVVSGLPTIVAWVGGYVACERLDPVELKDPEKLGELDREQQ